MACALLELAPDVKRHVWSRAAITEFGLGLAALTGAANVRARPVIFVECRLVVDRIRVRTSFADGCACAIIQGRTGVIVAPLAVCAAKEHATAWVCVSVCVYVVVAGIRIHTAYRSCEAPHVEVDLPAIVVYGCRVCATCVLALTSHAAVAVYTAVRFFGGLRPVVISVRISAADDIFNARAVIVYGFGII